ncbi:MAG: peptidase M28, partial [Cytophagaceae bacterium]
MTKKRILLFLCAGLIQSVSAQTISIPADAQQAAKSVRPEAIEAHMRYLADDKLQGRKPGTPGFELAAQYVEKQFTTLGFKPAGQNGGFRQAVPLRKAQVRDNASSMTLIQ